MIRRDLRSMSMALSLTFLTACSAPREVTVTYDERFGDSTSMDMYLPAERATPRPAVFIVHGGAWRFFHKERWRSVGRRLARSGYVATSVEYRLVPEGRFPNAPRDVGCALAFLQNHANEFNVDPTRIATLGFSAGGHLTALVAVANDLPEIAPDCSEGTPVKPAASISAAGPMDLFQVADVAPLHDFLGGTPTALASVYVAASPIFHVTDDDPPFLFIHGSRDLICPIEQSIDMRDELRSVGLEASLLEMRGYGHLVSPIDEPGSLGVETIADSPEAWIAIMDFLERTIGRP